MKDSIYHISLQTPVGSLRIFADDHFLYQIAFPDSAGEYPAASTTLQEHPLLSRAAAQLMEYFSGCRQAFDLPLSPQGTRFQQAVWDLMQDIPFGETRTYGELAAHLGNPNKARAVGGAANKNPLPLVIPCHRVVGTNGKLTGFAGGIETKLFLLELEQKKTYLITLPFSGEL